MSELLGVALFGVQGAGRAAQVPRAGRPSDREAPPPLSRSRGAIAPWRRPLAAGGAGGPGRLRGTFRRRVGPASGAGSAERGRGEGAAAAPPSTARLSQGAAGSPSRPPN